MSRPVFSRSARAFVEDDARTAQPGAEGAGAQRAVPHRRRHDRPTARRPCLVLAPHPDDETLGVGATIMRKVDAGTPVHLVVATDGSKSPPGDPAAVTALRSAELRRRVRGARPVGGRRDPASLRRCRARRKRGGARRRHRRGRGRPAPGRGAGHGRGRSPRGPRRARARPHDGPWPGPGCGMLTYPIWQFDRPARLVRQLRPREAPRAGADRRLPGAQARGRRRLPVADGRPQRRPRGAAAEIPARTSTAPTRCSSPSTGQ